VNSSFQKSKRGEHDYSPEITLGNRNTLKFAARPKKGSEIPEGALVSKEKEP